MRAGTPAFPVWVPAPRSVSGTGFAGMTPLAARFFTAFRMTWGEGGVGALTRRLRRNMLGAKNMI